MTLPLQVHRARSRGFTLIEIIVAMVFLAVGIMGVVALFVLGAKSSAESAQMTRAAMIAQDVRDALVNAMKYPIDRAGQRYMRFELPHGLEYDDVPVVDNDYLNGPPADLNILNGFYFRIDNTVLPPWDTTVAPPIPPAYIQPTAPTYLSASVLHLPFNGLKKDLTLITGASPNYVWWYYPPFFNSVLSSDFDLDDYRNFCFRIEIRRSREVPSAGEPSAGELFNCRVYVYKNFFEQFVDGTLLAFEATLADTNNIPIYQADFYIPGY